MKFELFIASSNFKNQSIVSSEESKTKRKTRDDDEEEEFEESEHSDLASLVDSDSDISTQRNQKGPKRLAKKNHRKSNSENKSLSKSLPQKRSQLVLSDDENDFAPVATVVPNSLPPIGPAKRFKSSQPAPPDTSSKKAMNIISPNAFHRASTATASRGIAATSPTTASPPSPSSDGSPVVGGEGSNGGGVMSLGGHEHNFFDFLQPDKIRDKLKLRPDHPNYNRRTLYVPESFLKEQSPAMVQWWQLKADCMDTVLFFKVGKFYELFHMDADVGFSELDLIYMRGSKAHSGFPEVAYGKMANTLVCKGTTDKYANIVNLSGKISIHQITEKFLWPNLRLIAFIFCAE